MCLLLRKSELFRLVLGIITMFILCLPEFFKIHEANTVIVSCMDTCSSSNTTFPLCTFNNSCKRSVQQRRGNGNILLKAILNHSNFQDVPCTCQSFRTEQQSHTKHTECESKRGVNVDHQDSVAKKTLKAKGSLEVKTEDIVYFYKHFNFTTFSEKEEVEHNTYYLLEIHMNNSIVRGRNTAEEYEKHSCLVAMMEDQNDCINISLQLKSYVEYPMCMAKIIWLTMIPVVIVFTISIVIYKIVQENERNYCKHRVTAVSTILRRGSSRHARRTISATKIHPFPVKTSEQQIPLAAQTTQILPIIPEREHCHVGASTVEGTPSPSNLEIELCRVQSNTGKIQHRSTSGITQALSQAPAAFLKRSLNAELCIAELGAQTERATKNILSLCDSGITKMFSYLKESLSCLSSSKTPTQTTEDTNYAGKTVKLIAQNILAKAYTKSTQQPEEDYS